MPQFSNGWLHGYQSRKNIGGNTQYGEARSLSANAATEMMQIRQALSIYAPQDIFNCDEAGLCWKMIPDKSLSTQSIPGRKKEKARINALFCCNSDSSERLPIWFIGTAKRPKAFTAAGINTENLGCVWRSNKKAWVTAVIFKEWLLWFDKMMAGRKVVLLMDNLSAHETAFKDIGSHLQNTLIIWLPSNSTTPYQPLDQGIIPTWKAYWKRQWILYILAEFDRGFNPVSTMTVLQALRWAISAWNIDLKSDTIRRCFKRALSIENAGEIEDQELLNELQQGLQKLQLSNKIQEAMDINQFLNPQDEQMDDNFADLDDIILSQFAATEPESDDENWEPLPRITASDALQCLYKFRLFEEQQVDADRSLIQHLIRHERVLARKKVEKQQQCDIRQYFR